MKRAAVIRSAFALVLLASFAGTASAQISSTEIGGLSGARVYRSNAAFDSVNGVYLVITQRPPVRGRMLDSNGNQIGPDFAIAGDEEGYTGWASVAFGGPVGDPAFLVTYIVADLNANPKRARLIRFTPGQQPSVSPYSHVTDVGSEWLFGEKAQNVWSGTHFVIGSRVMHPGAGLPTAQVNAIEMNGAVSAPVLLGDGGDYHGSPSIACSTGGLCLAIGFMAGIPTGFSGGTYGRLFESGALTPQGGLFNVFAGLPNEDQTVVYQQHTGFFLAQWFRGGGSGFIDTRLIAVDGSMSAVDLTRGIGPGAGCNHMVYNPATQTTLLVTKLGAAQLTVLELGDDGYPIRPNNFVVLTDWDGSVLDYLPSLAANPVSGQWLATAELTASPRGWIVSGTPVAGGVLPISILTSATLPPATATVPYTQFLVANGSTLPYTWTLIGGALPPGMNVVGSTATGTPGVPGTYNFRLRVTGGDGQIAERDFSILVKQIISIGPGNHNTVISANPTNFLYPGNAYRNNVAFDPIRQLYLVIVRRPPVSGRFYDVDGNPVGPEFVIATEPDAFSAWASITAGGPPNDPAFMVTYTIADLAQNPKFGRLVRYIPGTGPVVTAPTKIMDVGSEWLYSEKGQNRWNGSQFVIGSRVKLNGANVPTPVVHLFDMAGNVSALQNLGDGQDYYGSPALACAANNTCIAIGFMAGIPTGFTGGTYARLFTGSNLAPQGGLFTLATGRPNEDQGVVYQEHTGYFLAQWFRGGGPGFIDTRLVGTDGTMSVLNLNRGFGPGAGCNAFAYNPITRTTLLLTKGTAAELLAFELGDDGYPLNPANQVVITQWDGAVLDYLPSIAADNVNARWLVTWELQGGGFYRIVQGTADPGNTVNPVQNSDFSNGLGSWSVFGLPAPSNLVTNLNGGVLEFYRNPGAPGETTQAVVFQSFGMSLGANAPVGADFDLGNSSSARKRITVLLHDSDFSDLQMCTFWLEPFAPLRRYSILTHSSAPWTNATISFYAASEGSNGGAYLLDNVNVFFSPGQPTNRTDCVDPTIPAPLPGGGAGPNLITNSSFAQGLAGWSLFGQVSALVSSEVLHFVRPAGNPAGAVVQSTGVGLPSDSRYTATFELGNNSNVRKRITVLLHDADFSDLAACTFWLEAQQPRSTYTMRTVARRNWANVTIAFYLANVDLEPFALVDNVTLKLAPGASVPGTSCVADSSGLLDSTVEGGADGGVPTPTVQTSPVRSGRGVPIAQDQESVRGGTVNLDAGWTSVGPGAGADLEWRGRVWNSMISDGETSQLNGTRPIDLRGSTGGARLQFSSWRSADSGSATVQVSVDGVSWTTIDDVSASNDWTTYELNLDGFAGQLVFVRFVHTADATGDTNHWRLMNIRLIAGLIHP